MVPNIRIPRATKVDAQSGGTISGQPAGGPHPVPRRRRVADRQRDRGTPASKASGGTAGTSCLLARTSQENELRLRTRCSRAARSLTSTRSSTWRTCCPGWRGEPSLQTSSRRCCPTRGRPRVRPRLPTACERVGVSPGRSEGDARSTASARRCESSRGPARPHANGIDLRGMRGEAVSRRAEVATSRSPIRADFKRLRGTVRRIGTREPGLGWSTPGPRASGWAGPRPGSMSMLPSGSVMKG